MAKPDFDRLMEILIPIHGHLSSIRASIAAGITVTVHHVHDAASSADTQRKLDSIIAQGATIMTQLDDLNVKLATLETDVAGEKTVGDGMAVLLAEIKHMLDNAIGGATDLTSAQARVGAVSAVIEANTTAWAKAVLDNTPSGGGAVIALPGATLGAAYSATLDLIPGLAPFTNTISGGALPDGLVADASAPLISGTPERIGDFAFAWTSTDADPTSPDVVRNYTISVT